MNNKNVFEKINQALFEENCEHVNISYEDYQALILNKHFNHKNYEPEAHRSLLILGLIGYLYGPNKEPSKPIYVSKLVRAGTVQGTKLY